MIQSGMARNWGDQQQHIGELFDGLPHELSREEKFEQFVNDNPAFVQKFCDRALREYAAGERRGSAKHYFEDFRKDSTIVWHGKYRLNNDFTSFMAREAVRRYPVLDGFFEFRGLAEAPMKRVYVRDK